MAKLTDQEVVNIVNAEFDSAQGAEGGDIAEERARALDYYMRKPYGTEEEGSSAVVSSDVSDVVDGTMPSLLRIFTSADNLVQFDAVGPEDEPSADQESDFVTYTFFKRNPAFLILFYWMFDALVQKNGIVKAWWDESEEVTNEEYEGLSEIEVFDLMEDDELEPVERVEREAETVDDQGNIVVGIVHDIKFKRVSKSGRVVVENVPPEEYRISGDSRSLDPTKARMSGHEREVKRSDLLDMGFNKKIVAELPAEDPQLGTTEKISRRDKSDEQKNQPATSKDPSQDVILLREGYMLIDTDGNGRSELKQVFTANGKELEIEDADRSPFHVICPNPLPHKHFGQAWSEKVMDNQVITSELLRQTLDNLYRTNRPGHAVWEQGMGENTMDDLLTTKVGTVNRFKRPPGESYAPMTVPFTAAATFPMIEYFDKAKKDRTGIGSDSEGLSPDALKNIQTTVMAQSVDLSKMKIEQVARIFAETGFKSLFKHIHELLQKHQQKAEVVKLRGQWVPVRPSEWRTRKDMTVNIGLGIGTREQNLLHLNAIWEKQAQMAASGGMNLTVTPKNIYNTAAELVKNANLKLPSQYFTDPGDQKAPPPSSEQEQLQKQAQQLQADKQQLEKERNQVNMGRLQLQNDEQQLNHARKEFELIEKREARLDKALADNEAMQNELVKLRMESEDADRENRRKDVETIASVENKQADTGKKRAETAKIVEEIDGQSIENAAAESGLTDLVNELGGPEETE